MRILRTLGSTVTLLLPVATAAAQPSADGSRAGAVPPLVVMEHEGLFQARLARAGEDLFIAGQPTERGLREMQRLGVATVINLRTPEEMRTVRFDEPALVAALGMRYVYIPVRGNTEYPYSPEALAAFTEALRSAEGKVLLHCTVAWRTSHLWAAYLIEEEGVSPQEAIAHTRAINLMDTHRMGSGGRQPLEEFLDQPISELGRR